MARRGAPVKNSRPISTMLFRRCAHDVPAHEGETLKITGRECKGRTRGTQRSITGGTSGEYPGIKSFCIIPRRRHPPKYNASELGNSKDVCVLYRLFCK